MSSSSPSAIQMATGDDEFAIKECARKLVAELRSSLGVGEEDLEIIDGAADGRKAADIIGLFIQSWRTPAFLSGQKIVWLKDFQHFELAYGKTPKGYSAADKKAFEELLTLLKSEAPPEGTVVVINGPNLHRGSSFYKTMGKKAKIEFFKKIDGADKNFAEHQRRTILDACRAAGKNIEPAAITFLTQTMGSDGGTVHNEMEKLICLTADRDSITIDDCRKITSRTDETVYWAFSDALVRGDVEACFEAIDSLVEQKKSGSGGGEIALIGGAVKSFQEVVKTKTAAAGLGVRGNPGENYFYSVPAETKESHPGNFLLKLHPFRAYKLCETAARISDRGLAAILRRLLETQRQLVSGGVDREVGTRIALEQTAIAVCREIRGGARR